MAQRAAQKQLEQVLMESRLADPEYVAQQHASQVRSVLAELARRKCESLRLYEPLPPQEAFHRSQAKIRVLRGSNRGGKTLPAAVEIARAVCGCDPYRKYPLRDGRAFIVGKDLSHIGEVMWRKLGRATAFKMIRDRKTKEWRSFRPWDADDADRREDARLAPPLVPPRLIKEISWELKRESIPSVVHLHNGWELAFYSSLGKPPQGSDVDLVWMDEEIVDPEWFPEMATRLADRKGRMIWSATPQSGTDQLFGLHEDAERLAGSASPRVEEFIIRLSSNPYIEEAEKVAMAEALSEEERAVRIDGEFALLGRKVYPTFSMHLHGIDPFPIPAEWMRVMVVDPGYQLCAVLFAAVPGPAAPPPLGGDYVYLYDELYIPRCDAHTFGAQVAKKVGNQAFQTFIVDPHMSLATDVGSGKTVARQYSDALKQNNIHSVSTGSDFLLGSDDIKAGILAVHEWLRVRPDGTTKLRVLRDCLPNFVREIGRYHRKVVNRIVVDEPNQKAMVHLMDTLRYLALHNPKFVKPKAPTAKVSGALKAFRAKQERLKEARGGGTVHLGSGSMR